MARKEELDREEALEIYAIDRELLSAWSARLTRRMVCGLTVSDGRIYLTVGEESLTGAIDAVSRAR